LAPKKIPDNAVLVTDGCYLFKPVFNQHWDLRVYLKTDFATALERGARRDQNSLGGYDEAKHRFLSRSHAASKPYISEVGPELIGDWVSANNEHYLALQRQNASGTVKRDGPRGGADTQIRIIGTGPRDQGAGGDDPQVDHHVVGREYPACLHVRPAFPMFGYEQQTTGIGNQCDECDSHHHQRFRLTTEYNASHHLYEHAHSQDQLQYTSKMRGTYLHFHAMSNRIKGKPVHRRIGKIVQGFSNQAGGLGDQTGSHFHHEQKCIDAEQPAQ